MNTLINSVLICTALAFLTSSQGCQQGADGPKRYELWGTATFNGTPITKGSISFEPDSSAGNSGPGSIALIENGTYRTEPGKGVVGGAYRVFIVGFDGKSPDGLGDGNPLFSEIRLEQTFPHENAQVNFELPR